MEEGSSNGYSGVTGEFKVEGIPIEKESYIAEKLTSSGEGTEGNSSNSEGNEISNEVSNEINNNTNGISNEVSNEVSNKVSNEVGNTAK